MKILQTNLSLTPINHQQSNNYTRSDISRELVSVSQTAVSPSFRHKYTDIIRNNDKTQQVLTGLLAIGGIALAKEIAEENANANTESGTTETKKSEKQNPLDFLCNFFQSARENEQRVQKLEEENKGFKQVILNLQEQVAKLTASLSGQKQAEDTQKQTSEGNNEAAKPVTVKISFPKKHGRLSKIQAQLKAIIESVNFEKETAQKASEICAELMSKEPNENINKEELTENFAKELNLVKDDNAKVNSVVDNYYQKCGLKKDSETTDVKSSKSEHNENSTNLFTTNGQTYNPKGKMDLKDTKRKVNTERKRPRIQGKRDVSQVPQKVEVGIGTHPNSLTLKIPNNAPNDLSTNLTDAMNAFREKYQKRVELNAELDGVSPQKIVWTTQRPVTERVYDTDVENEIESCKEKGNNKTPYKNIKAEDVQDVADILNSDDRYSELFGLHGAMREIERFVNLGEMEDSNAKMPIEDRAKHVTSVLIRTINNALKKGVEAEVHPTEYYDKKTKTTKEYTGIDIIIPKEYLDKEAVEIFRFKDLRIGISEGWDSGHKRSTGKAIIGTIYSD